jgi:hypothetical protein
MKIRTRVGFLILHWMFSLTFVIFHYFSDSVLLMQMLRDNLTVSIVYSIFFSKNCLTMLLIFCRCGLVMCPMSMVPIRQKKNISRPKCSMLYCQCKTHTGHQSN